MGIMEGELMGKIYLQFNKKRCIEFSAASKSKNFRIYSKELVDYILEKQGVDYKHFSSPINEYYDVGADASKTDDVALFELKIREQ